MICGAAIVETRNINVGEIIHQHFRYLPKDWGLTFFGSSENEAQVREYFPSVNFVLLRSGSFSAANYNELITMKSFWSQIPYDKVLIFQHDSRLLRDGIEDFLQYDYIGAPLYHIPFPCMNGGLSLRSKAKMLEVINNKKYHAPTDGNEDIYFCKQLQQMGANLPTKEEAMKFSVETIYYPTPLGVHAMEKYLTNQQVKSIYENAYNPI